MKELLKISFNDDTGQYNINVAQGSSLQETAFCVSTLVRVLVRDKIIKEPSDFLGLVIKYLDDPQYEEVKNEDNIVDGTRN